MFNYFLSVFWLPLFFLFQVSLFAISCFYSLFLAKLKRIPIYPFAPCTGILLDHQPFNLKETEAADIDLQFSGHTHHGQIWPINWVTDYIFEQSHGYRQWGNTHIYVSSGLSLWGPPFRIGTHGEMVIFNFQWILI